MTTSNRDDQGRAAILNALCQGFSREEAATRLGISVRMVQRLEETGQIRTVRIGHRVIIPATEVARLLAEGTRS